MRIAYLSVSGGLGGSEIALLNLVKGLRQSGKEFELHLIVGGPGPLAGLAAQLGVAVHALPFSAALGSVGESGPAGIETCWSLLKGLAAAIGYAVRLRRLLAEIKPDLVHSNGLKMHLLAAWVRPVNTPLFWHVHDYVGRRSITRHLLRLGVHRVRTVICNSGDVAADLKAAGLDCREAATIYNGIDTERFSGAGTSSDLDALSGLSLAPAGTVRIGLVGTFAKWKGHRVFLEAISRLPRDGAVRAYIVGAPIYQTASSQFSMAELKAICAELSLGEEIGFTGFVENAAAAMRALDIVVHASTEPEPFGMVIAEAMACGRAVVASRAGGAREILVESENALGHTPGDAKELAACLERLVLDVDLRRRLGNEGAQHVRQKFGLERCALQVAALYARALESPGRVPQGLPVAE